LVHCSAGVGRTGTFIGTYAVLSSLHGVKRDKHSILIPLLVREMRKQRISMVQSLAQYEFLYKSALIASDEVVRASTKGLGSG
jgi:protein tyrosine phosphatase